MITATYILTLIPLLIVVGLTLAFEPSHFEGKSYQGSMKILRNIALAVLVLFIILLSYQEFPLTLSLAVIIMGVISLIDKIWFDKKRKAANKTIPVITEYSRSLFLVLLLVWVIRSFLVQPYRVPTGSLEPTIEPGDLIAVNQFAYGLRLPVLRKKIVSIGDPKVGDIVLFHWPPHPLTLFVKRLIGVPGDHIIYKNKILYINGKEMPQKLISKALDVEPGEQPKPVELKEEDLMGVHHKIYVRKTGGETADFNITVPKGMYYMMGDNRDDSDDSRAWGFVPARDLVGKAFIVWMSWDPFKHRIRWDRIGTWIK